VRHGRPRRFATDNNVIAKNIHATCAGCCSGSTTPAAAVCGWAAATCATSRSPPCAAPSHKCPRCLLNPFVFAKALLHADSLQTHAGHCAAPSHRCPRCGLLFPDYETKLKGFCQAHSLRRLPLHAALLAVCLWLDARAGTPVRTGSLAASTALHEQLGWSPNPNAL